MPQKKEKLVLCKISAPVAESYIEYSPRSRAFGMFHLKEYCLARETIRNRYCIEVKYYDSGQGEKSIASALLECEADIIGFSCHNSDFKISTVVAEDIKTRRPETLIILGGPSLSDVERDIRRFAFADIIVPFEGELPLTEWLEKRADGVGPETTPGIAWRRGEEARFNGLRKDVADLIDYPVVFSKDFVESLSGAVIYQTSRGCRHNCAYCMSAGTRYREFPMERVKRELGLLLSNKKINYISLADLDIAANPTRLEELLKFIRDNNERRVPFFAFINAEPYVADFLDLMQKASFLIPGMQEFCVALQSGSDEVLKMSRRKWFTLDKLKEVAPKVLKKNPDAKVELILGLPGETLESQKRTLFEIFRMGFRKFHLFEYLVNPGSEFYSRREELGIEVKNDENYALKRIPTMSERDIDEVRRYENNFHVLMRILDPTDMGIYEEWGLNIMEVADKADFISHPYFKTVARDDRFGAHYLADMGPEIIDSLMDCIKRERLVPLEKTDEMAEYLKIKLAISGFEHRMKTTARGAWEGSGSPLAAGFMKFEAGNEARKLLGLRVMVDKDGAARPAFAIFSKKHLRAALVQGDAGGVLEELLEKLSKETSLANVLKGMSDPRRETAARMLRRMIKSGIIEERRDV